MHSPTGLLDLRDHLDLLRVKHGIPGVSVAILQDGIISRATAGIANLNTGVPVTEDTIFLIGSITKVLTTSLLMQFVDSGEISLDEPLVTYLPDLTLATPEFTRAVTVRHLLTHTNGIAGDYLQDFGSGEEAVARYAASLSSVPQLYTPGAMFSYSNSAFNLAGHLIERLTGQTWHAALKQRLLDPLGMSSTVTLPEDGLRFPVAVAHQRHPDDPQTLRVGEMWREFHAGAPAGFTPYATPADLLTFAQFHLDGGCSRTGDQVLSAQSVALMQSPQVTSIPSGPFDVTGWGLGWILHEYSHDTFVIGHNGGSSATLRVIPSEGFAVAVLTNAGGGVRLGQELIAEIVQRKFSLTIPTSSRVPASTEQRDFASYAGQYHHLQYSATVEWDGQDLTLATGSRGTQPGERVALVANSDTTFTGNFRDRGAAKVSFLIPDGLSAPSHLHIGLRAYPRAD